MGLEKFKAAVDALPEKINGDELADFLAAVTVIYVPAKEAVKVLALAAGTVFSYLEDMGEDADAECNCDRCAAKRTEKIKH